MITIYGSPRSSAGRCYWCLEEAELSYEAKNLSFKDGENKAPEYLKLNPNGKVPTLKDGDLTLWESMAINFYLADNYKPELLGNDAKERGLVHQWSFWSMCELQPPLIDIFIQLVFVPEERRDYSVIEKAHKKLPNLLAVLDKSLEGKQYLATPNFTLGDMHAFSVVNLCKSVNVDLAPYKNIGAWMDKISKRPAYQKFQELCK